jgi:hypothetical protein
VCFGVVVEYFHVVEGTSDPCHAFDQTPAFRDASQLRQGGRD